MTANGYAGRILRVDLTTGEHVAESLSSDEAHLLIGGFGMNNALAYRDLPPGVDALSEANPIVLGAGPLVGTMAPGSVRVMATTKQPMNGAVAAAAGSMSLGAQLKWAGYDHLVITGRSSAPVILVIQDDRIEIRDAGDLWGQGLNATTDELKKRYSDAGVLAIGPAGEQRVALALALIDRTATLGRGGLGAVMGSKGLKAVIVRGTKGTTVADSKRFMGLVEELYKRLAEFPARSLVLEWGMMAGWDSSLKTLFPESPLSDHELTRTFGPEVYRGLKARRAACPSCFLPCKDVLRIPGEEKESTPTSYINVPILAYRLGMDAVESARLLDRLDDLGIDFMPFRVMVDWAISASEKGVLGGESLPRNAATAHRLLDDLLAGRGVGGVMGQGWRALVEEYGEETLSEIPLIRWMEPLFDPRFSGLGTMEFEQIVCPRGPTSATAGSPTYLPGVTPDKMARHLDRMGVPPQGIRRVLGHPLGLDVGRLSRYAEDWYSALSSLGICMRAHNNRFYGAELCAELYEAATGLPMERDGLMRAADRSWTLMRLLNAREGFKRQDDRIPSQWFQPAEVDGKAAVMKDYYQRATLTPEDLEGFLAGYYDERGWEPDTGLPSAALLQRLALERFL
jgi:aldehyde:ferredoxin oxidoreductase